MNVRRVDTSANLAEEVTQPGFSTDGGAVAGLRSKPPPGAIIGPAVVSHLRSNHIIGVNVMVTSDLRLDVPSCQIRIEGILCRVLTAS